MFNEKLKELRKNLSLTQSDMAKKLNITSVAYGDYERGKSEPDIETLKKIASILNVSVDYLIEYDKTATSIEDKLNEVIKIVEGILIEFKWK